MTGTSPGFFMVIDGIDGSGKSTQIRRVQKHLIQNNIPCYVTAEPTKGEIGILLRKYLKDPSIPAVIDALLFAADRIDHCVREIQPHLDQGEIVITDRYRDSSFVYQSVEGKNDAITMEWMREINKFAFSPDLTIILDLDPRISLDRRNRANKENASETEKFENLQFLEQVRTGFLKLAQLSSSGQYAIIDANQPEDTVFHEIVKVLLQHRSLKFAQAGK
jgi:dTMP kinase